MNILHVDTEKYWRGGQQQVLYLHEGLIKQGISSLLICNKNSEIKNRCIEKNLPFIEINILGELDLFSAYKISKLCKANTIDIIQAHSAHALTIAIIAKLFYSKLKLIAVRRVDFHIRKNILSKLKYSNKKVDKIVCISEFIKKVLMEDGIDENKLLSIRSGTDVNKFDNISVDDKLMKTLKNNSDTFLIGTVAAFAGHKDYPNLLKAFKIVKAKYENAKLCIVGDGPLKNEIENIARKLNIYYDIYFVGFQNDIGMYLKIFDLFVLSSKKEGLGTSIIDAMSIGLTIVATNTGGIPELIKNYHNGILVEPKNPNDLSKAIIELIENKVLRKLVSENAKKDSVNYSIDKNIEQYKKLYNDLLLK
ncbi:MAG: glycosyltransferase family 4 protein [Ignavibacteriae bacterium]|nr:glycosyltransferase family 4 protein [Ignavibacteriota bacterium]